MDAQRVLGSWRWIAPLVAWLVLAASGPGTAAIGGGYALVIFAALAVGVIAAVHHAEVVALRVGEPYGTLVLALAVTVIEVALIVSLMSEGGANAAPLARDTIFAAIMLILNGMTGLCMLIGGLQHREQSFDTRGVSSALAVLAALSVLTLVLPNHTTSLPGPVYTSGQLIGVSVASLVLYGLFVLIQTVRHRDYFLPANDAAAADPTVHVARPSAVAASTSLVLLFIALGAVVWLAKALSAPLEGIVSALGAPRPIVGILIATLVLLPEGTAALRAARNNRLQTSFNLALGSALASIALTIPAVAMLTIARDSQLVLGLDTRSTVLLLLSLLVATISLSTGRTTVLTGAVHLVILAAYLLTTLLP